MQFEASCATGTDMPGLSGAAGLARLEIGVGPRKEGARPICGGVLAPVCGGNGALGVPPPGVPGASSALARGEPMFDRAEELPIIRAATPLADPVVGAEVRGWLPARESPHGDMSLALRDLVGPPGPPG